MLKIIIGLLFVTSTFAASMQEMVEYLASDQLEGRKPGQTGNELATQYIIKQLQDAGVAPLGQSYRQEFTIFTQMRKRQGENFFTHNSQLLPFEPLSFSLSAKLEKAQIVFAGFGISIPANDPKLSYDDYQGINVKDKVVVVMTGDPAIGNPSSAFRHPDYISYRSLFYKMRNAVNKGAIGFILIENPLSLTGEEPALVFNATEGGGSRFDIVAGKTSVATINGLLPHKSVKNLQVKIANTQRPHSFGLQTAVDLSVGLKKLTGRVANINALIPGTKKETIVLGAHMDHLGFGGESSMEADRSPKIHNGADDNASGTALVIKLAQKLQQQHAGASIAISLFNAEEMGLLGSQHFITAWSQFEQKLGPIKAMLNFDMVGRFNQEISIMGVGSSKQWPGLLLQTPQARKFTAKKDALGSSDHASFSAKKIPVLFFTTGAHEDYHRSTDDSDKIDYKSIQALLDYALEMIPAISKAAKLDFDTSYGSDRGQGQRGYGASLGCRPQFGQSDDIIGVVCSGVSPGSAAAQAGIKQDDVLTQIGDINIKTVYDLAFALRFYRPGDEVEIKWKSGNMIKSKKVILKKSSRG